ncbi:MAG: O-antigen ligase family protein [Candidatus Absconditabacteria bacterium]
MSKFSSKDTLILISKIFFIGLLLQFFLQTFVSFGLGRNGTFWSLIWMRKEIIIIGLIGYAVYRLIKTHTLKSVFDRLGIRWFALGIIILTVFVFLTSLLITHVSISTTIISLRYSITGFVVFIAFALISFKLFPKTTLQDSHIEVRYVRVIKRLLVGSLIWWLIIFFVPRLLEFAGYNKTNYEGDIGIAPPAVYYSQYNDGYARNQFLFERPISRGFFLIALWPLFFALALKKRKPGTIILWGSLYALAILSTFSRAAWIAWFLQTAILILVEYRQNLKKILLYGGLPLVLLFGTVTYLGRDQIINRQFSNTGHFDMIEIALGKIADKPRFGQGAASAGPASHHLGKGKEYNPENQFLQIWIEYGIFGFLGWMSIFIRLHRIGIVAFKKSQIGHTNKQKKYFGFLLFACSLGIAGLSLCGLVLHSFIDRMIVYPFMAIFGIIYGLYKNTEE